MYLPSGCWSSPLRLCSISICGHWTESALRTKLNIISSSAFLLSLRLSSLAPEEYLFSSPKLQCVFSGTSAQWLLSSWLSLKRTDILENVWLSGYQLLFCWVLVKLELHRGSFEPYPALIRQESLFPPLATFVILEHDLLCS